MHVSNKYRPSFGLINKHNYCINTSLDLRKAWRGHGITNTYKSNNICSQIAILSSGNLWISARHLIWWIVESILRTDTRMTSDVQLSTYLCDRYQYLSFVNNNSSSSKYPVIFPIVQSPLLFIMHVKDPADVSSELFGMLLITLIF